MMIHEKLISGQFLLDFKNDHTGLLQAAAVAHHQQPMHHLQPPSPPMPALDIYSAYAYQQQLQQKFLNSAIPHHHPTANQQSPQSAEVLDLSRRDSVETPRKTPSPYHTNSSFGTGSPAGSPNTLMAQQQAAALIPANLLYAAQAQQQQQQQQAQQLNPANLNIPANLAALYTGRLYYPNAIKQEPISTTPPPPPSNQAQTAPIGANNTLLQSFASAAAAAAASSLQQHQITPEPHSPQQQQQQQHQSNAVTTPTSSTSNLASHDAKSTRPFKAFPRDPLVIAANFAATDCLLDNPRVERYTEYRKRVLEQIRSSNGGSRTVTNPKMRRINSATGSIHEGSSSNNSENDDRHHAGDSSDCDSNSGNDALKSSGESSNQALSASGGLIKDSAYYERRRKNNAAAKKSRDRRRIKEDEIAIRAAYLERQNIELLCQIDALKSQLATLTSKMA